jgi:hypothetical protein
MFNPTSIARTRTTAAIAWMGMASLMVAVSNTPVRSQRSGEAKFRVW